MKVYSNPLKYVYLMYQIVFHIKILGFVLSYNLNPMFFLDNFSHSKGIWKGWKKKLYFSLENILFQGILY